MDPPASADVLAWIALRGVPQLGRARAWELIRRFGSPRAVLSAAPSVRPRLPPRARAGFEPGALLDRAAAELESARSQGLRALVPRAPGYPPGLAQIPDPPLVVYLNGELPDLPTLAIVGGRRASDRARRVAEDWSAVLARAGAAIVSGLAYGVDAAAHRGALAGGGPTVAVLASGADLATPVGQRRLAEAILVAGGGWLSEYPPGTEARARHFPERNRLISGLARATWIVEARERSGSLWTARHALDQGRDVLVSPGPVDTDLCRGSNGLLRDGAVPILDADDLRIAVLGGSRRVRAESSDPFLRSLADGPLDLDALADATGLGPGELAARLLELELQGRIERRGARVALRDPA